MKVNHDKTKNLIINITDILKTQAQVAKNFKVESDRINADKTYSQKYKADLIAKSREDYNVKYNETKDKITAKLEEILKIELKNEEILELDVPEFSNTLAAINSAQGNLPGYVIENIKINFAGQYQALSIIAAAFENYNVNLSKYGYTEYLRSADIAIEQLINKTRDIEQSEISTFISLKNLLKDVIRFGEVRGITFNENVKTLGADIDDEARMILARKAIGLL